MPLIIADRVLEQSTTTGTGALTLAGASLGFRAFASVCSVADTVWYYIEGVDTFGVPTGEYEYGLGTYSAANQLTRTTVRGSSNGGSAVNFTAGTKLVGIAPLAPAGSAVAEWRSALGVDTGVTAPERDNSTKLATTAYVDRAGVPVGTIIAYAGPTIPAGYLVLPNAATTISRTTYAALFGAIGTYWGVGDGSTTFGMPYVTDDGTLVHSPSGYGVATVGSVIAHTHTFNVTTEMAAGANDGSARNSGTGLHTNNTSSTGGSANLASGSRVRFAIKY